MIFFENLHRFKKKILNNFKSDITENINFGSKRANIFFKNKLKKAKFYFEYGSGNSTLLSDSLNKNYFSIELDKNFYLNLRKKLKYKKKLLHINIGPVGEFSYPLIKNKIKIINYIETINKFFKKKKFPDLILIDGRFRVACCLNLYFLIKKHKINPLIILDDYKKRNSYKILNKFFRIKLKGRMGILIAVKNRNIKKSIINNYIYDSR